MNLPSYNNINDLSLLLRRKDILFGCAIIFTLTVMIFPIPSILLDLLLALSISIAIIVLMTVIFIDNALELSIFPVILLTTTVFRLSLNLASTRLILQNGYMGTDAAGDIIDTFSGFIMGNNFVIGIVIFCILILVNFLVITKGSVRIAEVTARFSLDALPGKQMAIDAIYQQD